MNWISFVFTIIGLHFATVSGYRTYYIEDKCLSTKHLQKVEYKIPALGSNSVGELRTNRFGTYSRGGRSCLIKLIPPSDHGVVVSVTKVDFRNHKTCEDYIKIYHEGNEEGEKLCGYQERGLDSTAFYAKDKMKILYHTEEGGWGFSDGFRLIFTVTKTEDENKSCSSEQLFKCKNNRCIWIGVTCDGYDNCGDGSDEDADGNSSCSPMSPIVVGGIVFGATILAAVLIAVLICCCKNKQSSSNKVYSTVVTTSKCGYQPIPGYTYGSVERPLMTQISLYPSAPTEKTESPYLCYQSAGIASPPVSSQIHFPLTKS